METSVNKRFLFLTSLVLLVALAPGSLLMAQLTTGTILGTVKDQTEAVLPGATVTVTNVETGIVRSATTGSRGEYRILALAVGTYDIQASMAGFQTNVHKGMTLSIGREAVVDFFPEGGRRRRAGDGDRRGKRRAGTDPGLPSTR